MSSFQSTEISAVKAVQPSGYGASSSASRAAPADLQRELLTFRLGAENYALNILEVQEIRSYEKPTHIAGTPSYVKGLIDLRGTMVPIIDMRERFGFESVEFAASTVVIVLCLGTRTVGLVVDAVEDVTSVAVDSIQDAPGFARLASANCINGLVTMKTDQGERMLILLDAELLLQGCGLSDGRVALA